MSKNICTYVCCMCMLNIKFYFIYVPFKHRGGLETTWLVSIFNFLVQCRWSEANQFLWLDFWWYCSLFNLTTRIFSSAPCVVAMIRPSNHLPGGVLSSWLNGLADSNVRRWMHPIWAVLQTMQIVVGPFFPRNVEPIFHVLILVSSILWHESIIWFWNDV